MLSRQSLDLRQSQQLALTPQLRQSIRFLRLSAQDLEAEVAQALQDNPLLERDDEYDTEALPMEPEAMDRDDLPVLATATRTRVADGEYPALPEVSQSDSLAQHLLRQLRLTRASERDGALVELLIGELDENGYLATPLDEIHACLPSQLEVEPEELHAALRLLQSFDPPGVGATSLRECLLLQLQALEGGVVGVNDESAKAEVLACACELVSHHLDLLAGGNLVQLRRVLSCSDEQLRATRTLLLGLDPKPGRGWAGSQADYVVPEVIARRVGKRWVARLNASIVPRLRVNTQYETWLMQGREAPDRDGDRVAGRFPEPHDVPAAGSVAPVHEGPAPNMYGQLLQSAHGLLRSVAQRFETILRVAQVLVEHQQAFFEHGPQAMRPLLLRDVAQELGLHESTVSRATHQKYLQTPWGVVEMKSFFGVALNTESGTSTSATAVRSMIRKLVAQERADKPLSDSRLAACLADQGITIARRTVAKYREAAGIEAATRRKARARLES
ncbi:MAG: RNA polymerase sigma-54 factor [Burkholderiaceae bacterium]|nr:MAG: RNA polymerase sigma-54 factor [Burkholderiaceae bacterium]TAM01546.1 MAG: RNA polymerase sigma-54 factor [Pusillimonas sp.]